MNVFPYIVGSTREGRFSERTAPLDFHISRSALEIEARLTRSARFSDGPFFDQP